MWHTHKTKLSRLPRNARSSNVHRCLAPPGARSTLFALGLAVLCLFGGCDGGSGGGTEGGKLRVAATTTMIGDLVRRIGGDRVDLAVLIPPGNDPHVYKPSPGDMSELRRAKLVFYNGLHLEGTMVDLFEDPGKKLKERSVAVAAKIPDEKLLGWQDGQGGAHDPHVWFDVRLWMIAAETVRDELVRRDPAGEQDYRRRAGELLKEMEALDGYVRERIGSIPKERRVLITSHDAYNYFGKAYGIEVRGLQGISTESEAGITAINSAVDYIIKHKIPAVFVESSVNPKTIQRVREDCRAQNVEVKIGGELYSDAMGHRGERKGYAVETYDGMVRYNVDTIAAALK